MKNRKNRMYGYHKYLSSTGSEGFKQIRSTTSSTTVAHQSQKYFCHLFWRPDSGMAARWTQFAQNAWFWCPKSMKILVSTLTSRSSNSMMPRSLRMFGHVFNVYSSRSRDLEGPYTERKSSRDRKLGQQLDDFCIFGVPAICPSLSVC